MLTVSFFPRMCSTHKPTHRITPESFAFSIDPLLTSAPVRSAPCKSALKKRAPLRIDASVSTYLKLDSHANGLATKKGTLHALLEFPSI